MFKKFFKAVYLPMMFIILGLMVSCSDRFTGETTLGATAAERLEDENTIQDTTLFENMVITVVPDADVAVSGDTVGVTITILDDQGGDPVKGIGVTLIGALDLVGSTNSEGVLQTTVTRSSQGPQVITAGANGKVESALIDFRDIIPGVIDNQDSPRNMRIYASKSQLRANNSDTAIVTVVLLTEDFNPAVGDSVTFKSDQLCSIDELGIIDETGETEVTLRSVPVNGVCTITAVALNRDISVSTQVIITGVTLKLVPDQTDLKINEFATVEIFLKDASDNPIGGEEVSLSLEGAGSAFENAGSTTEVEVNANGEATVKITKTSAGRATLNASALNAEQSVTVDFSNNTLSVSTDRSNLNVGGNDSSKVTATYVDGSNNPIADATIEFSTNAGTITKKSVKTNSSGVATTYIKSSDFTGTATIQASAANGFGQTTINFGPVKAASVALAITPDNIGINGGVASLIATVRDSKGNVVSGVDVNFRLLKGPGGGEAITKPVVTSQDGIAIGEFKAGSLPSLYRGTEIEASIGNAADTSKLTISGAPHIISVAHPESDTVPVQDAGQLDPSTFDYNVGAVVQDINGNRVADGTEVHFSAVVTGLAVGKRQFIEWAGIGSSDDEIKPVWQYVYGWDIPFEDINNNLTLDPAIDLMLDGNDNVAARGEDVNGDGVMDWNPAIHDTYYDFNGNGVCDPDVGENDTLSASGAFFFFDINYNGVRDASELINDVNSNGECDLPASGDYPFSTWERRHFVSKQEFSTNDFAVVIEATAVTKEGVAETVISYPRQFARQIIVNVNAEANGIRDRDGARFTLPQIVGK